MPDTLLFDPKQISDVLKRSISEYKSEVSVQEVGEVIDCGDGIARIKGLPNCMAEEMLEFPKNIFGMALNLEKEQVGVMILGDAVINTDSEKGLEFLPDKYCADARQNRESRCR